MKIADTTLNLCLIRLIAISIMVSLVALAEFITPVASQSSSPSFAHQEIMDGYETLLDLNTQNPVIDDPINILSVSYLSDGRHFNATLWLAYPLLRSIQPDAINRIYGMLIDADLNNQTGVQGADYRFEVEWRNKTKVWERIFEQLATPVSTISSNIPPTRILEIDRNYTDGLFKQDRQSFGQNFVELSADLGLMGYPERFRVTFFAQDIRSSKGSWIADFTNWVSIPPPELTISISPNPLVLKQGGHNTTEVKIESSAGYQPRVQLLNFTDRSGIKLRFADNELVIPSHGIAVTQLEVTAPSDVKLVQHSMPVEAVLTVPPRSVFEFQLTETSEEEEVSTLSLIPAALTNQTRNQQVYQYEILSVIVEPPQPVPDPITSFVNWLSPIAGLVGTLLGVAASAVAGVIGVKKYYERRDKREKPEETDY